MTENKQRHVKKSMVPLSPHPVKIFGAMSSAKIKRNVKTFTQQ